MLMREGDLLDRGLQYFPVGLFASVMGLGGLSVAYQRYEHIFNVQLGVGVILLYLSYVVFSFVAVTYLLKVIKYTPNAIAEFNHPDKVSFFATFTISLIILSIGTLEYQKAISHYLWILGATMHFLLTIIIIPRWINHTFEIENINPVWFLPVVGNILVPISGVQFVHPEILWFFFSIGFFFWVVLYTIIFYRLIFHSQLSPKLMPTLFILVAPPAVGFAAYTRITGQIDGFARMLLYIALFFVILLLSMARKFLGLNFFVSWWAYTFPLCAVTIASIISFEMLRLEAFHWLATILLIITTVVILRVAYKTLQALFHNKLCVREG